MCLDAAMGPSLAVRRGGTFFDVLLGTIHQNFALVADLFRPRKADQTVDGPYYAMNCLVAVCQVTIRPTESN